MKQSADLTPEAMDIFSCGYGGYHTCRIPALVTASDGTVLAFCEGRRSSPSDWGDIDIILRRSTDGGKSWGDFEVVAEEAGDVTIGNPVPIVDKTNGRVHLLFCRDGRRVFHVWSDTSGHLWSWPVEITNVFLRFRFSDDYEWDESHVLTGPVHGIQLGSGRLVAPIKFLRQEEHPAGRRRVGVIYSDDHGTTWNPGGIVPPSLHELSETTIFECSDGSICMNARWHEGTSRAVSRSHDGGLTWEEPQPEPSLPDPVCQGSSFSFADSDGARTVYLVNLADTEARRRLTIRRSTDDGRSWVASRILCQGPSGYSDIARAADGTMLVIFEHGIETYREKIALARLDPRWLESDTDA